MKNKKLVSTEGKERQKAILPKVKVKRIITTRSKDEKKTDRQFIAENLDALKDGDILNLKNKIQKVIESRKPTWWKCPKCGFTQKRPWNAQQTTCLKCNPKNYKDGSWVQKMSDSEVQKYLKERREKLQADYEARMKAGLARANRARREDGRPEIDLAEYKERQKRYFANLMPPARGK
jgi:ribosomal protein L37AE/L43A